MKETSKIIGGLVLAFLLATTGTGLGQETAANQGAFASINITETPVQAEPLSLSASDLPSLRSLSDAQLETFMNALDATPTIAFDALPRKGLIGTFYSLQYPDWPPLPGDTSRSPVWNMGDFYLISDLNFNYDAPQKGSLKSGGGMQAMAMSSPPGFGDGGGTNSFTANDTSYTLPDYGTNLWIAQVALASGYLTGIASNTLADVQYELQYVNDLTQTNWLSTGLFILGSETTNWTPLTALPVSLTNNFFIRLRSWADGGSGLPIWWQLQYFGTTGVDPYGNPAGDGWSNLQKFQNGWNPTNYYTPAAPQGLTVSYNANNNTATLHWLPASGNVTGYTITDSDGNTSNVSANTTTFTDSVATDQPDPWQQGNITTAYTVRANYAAGNSTASGAIPLEASTFSGVIAPGPQGIPQLLVSALPAGTAAIRLTEISGSALAHQDTNFYITNIVIPVSSFSNGVCALPNWANTNNKYGYEWVGRTVGTNGSLGAATFLIYGDYNSDEDNKTIWTVPPFYDGRVQLKQNLIFQLRAALMDHPFRYGEFFTDDNNSRLFYSAPTNYAYAGFYHMIYNYTTVYATKLEAGQPFGENAFYRNFVFDSTALDANGFLNTGIGVYENGYPNYDLSVNKLYKDWRVPWKASVAYQSTITNINTQPLLGANQTRWLASYPEDAFDYEIGVSYVMDVNTGEPVNVLDANARNLFGLPFLSVNIADGNSVTTLNAGGSTTQDGYLYPETAQPQFQTVEYDFWNPNPFFNTASQTWTSVPLPGTPNFSPTNQSQFLMTSVGNPNFQVAAYAKLAVQNGYSGVYGYLGQYFDRAYKMTNGVATTNTTGVLSPYGNFFATEPGAAALMTMPDIDTGARGTCMVYSVALQLDANHDGTMNLSFNGPDATSLNSPFVFWCNNNFDRWHTVDFTDHEQDDLKIASQSDCNFTDDYGHRIIPCTRDLEDFTRLWICGVTSNLLAALPIGSSVTLSWGDVGSPNSSNPTIDLFAAADADGGIGYLTNATVAAQQTNISSSAYIGRLGPGTSLQLNSLMNQLPATHFIWCGVSNGTGGLTLTIADASGNPLAQTTAYIQIKDIKQMYERWTVGDNASKAPLTTAIKSTQNLPVGDSAFQYTSPTDTNTAYILLVHGYNMAAWEKDRYVETAFKRLYWQGYQGRFGAFNWPTAQNPVQFGASELQAWQSAQGLLNKLNDLNAIYPGKVYLMAHSLGNVVAGEALRLAGNSQVVNTYVAMQGAVTAHAYDPTTTTYTLTEDWGAPDRYAHYYTNGAPCYFNASAGAGTYVNFFNTNDWALSGVWLLFQNSKPILDLNYSFTPPDSYFKNSGSTQLFFPANTYELFDEIIQSRSYALGMQPGVGGAFKVGITYNQVNLPSVWPPDTSGGNYGAHLWHSAEFRSDNPQRSQFWNKVLVQMGLK